MGKGATVMFALSKSNMLTRLPTLRYFTSAIAHTNQCLYKQYSRIFDHFGPRLL
jgi:hypothetical protein